MKKEILPPCRCPRAAHRFADGAASGKHPCRKRGRVWRLFPPWSSRRATVPQISTQYRLSKCAMAERADFLSRTIDTSKPLGTVVMLM